MLELNFSGTHFQVTDLHKLSRWLRQQFLSKIYNQPWYNGLEEKEDVYIANKISILIGMPSLRQLRIRRSRFSRYIQSLSMYNHLSFTPELQRPKSSLSPFSVLTSQKSDLIHTFEFKQVNLT